MHEPSTAAYPRRAGVVVPAMLLRAGFSAGPDPAGVAAETVKWMRGAFRHLPAEILEATLPDPAIILRSWSIGARTRGALARLGAPGATKGWRVRDLMGAARLGPAALVDLLAAKEESERQVALRPGPRLVSPLEGPAIDAAPAPPPGRLDGLAAAIRRRLPFRPEELGAIVQAARISTERPDVEEVARLFRDWGEAVPFRVVRRAGATVLVAPSSLASAEALLTRASHLVFHWGLCTVSTVMGRRRLPGLDANAAARVLATLPRFRWLDEASGWFSFVGYGSRVRTAVQKIFAIAERVTAPDLILGLAKRVRALAIAPWPAVEVYLSKVLGCEISNEWVRLRTPFVPEPLSGCERVIVQALRLRGGICTPERLRRDAVAAGAKRTAVRQFIRTSPLVIARDGKLELVGSPRSAIFAARADSPTGRRVAVARADTARPAASFG